MEKLDQIFELLIDERRRYVLYFLEQRSDPTSIDELAEQIAEWEISGTPESIPDETFERIEVELYHDNLPRASEVEYVRYDPDEKIVELTGAPPEFDAIVSVARVVDRPDRNP